MSKFLAITLLLSACMSAPETAMLKSVEQETQELGDDVAAPARDGNIAIREEFDAAKAKNTAEAYGLFIARHPHHPLAIEAKELKAKLELMEK